VQEKKVWVLELVPMDLLDKVEEIAMTRLLVLYNTNLLPHAICVLPPLVNPRQQGLGAEEELQEEESCSWGCY